jgi:Chitobiase/beta-hexosaminidase C-terminal domain
MRIASRILVALVVTLALVGCEDISLKGIIDQKLGIGGTVAAPTFNPLTGPAGTYASASSVNITCSTPNASIRFTTDGSTPSSTSGTLYRTPLSVDTALTIKAIAYESGGATSIVSAANFANPATTIRVGSIAQSRSTSGGWTLDGSDMVWVRAKLLNPANFGPGGTYSKKIVITDVSAAIDAGILANVDVFFIGYMGYLQPDFTTAELNAMNFWVFSGGVMIVTAGDQYSEQVSNAFGCPVTGTYAEGRTVPSASELSHPIWNGPFGTLNASSIVEGSGSGASWDLYSAPPGGTTGLAYDWTATGWTVLEGPFGSSGKVIFLGDVDLVCDDANPNIWNLDDTISAAAGNFGYQNEAFLGNLFAYAHR